MCSDSDSAGIEMAADVNGDLSHFLDAINKHCMTAIASAGFSGDSGRKEGIPKRKRKRLFQLGQAMILLDWWCGGQSRGWCLIS